MHNKDYHKQPQHYLFPSMDDESDRRLNDRRKHTSEGYTYISMVGWICRREQRRRRSDCNPSDINELKSSH